LNVPAREHAFNELPPAHLYLDTDILINYLEAARGQEHHERCTAFLQRIFVTGVTTIYVSSLSWLEFAHTVTRTEFRRRLPREMARRYPLGRWKEPRVRQAYTQEMLGLLDDLLSQYDCYEVPLTTEVRELSTRSMSEYDLGSHDAVHLASARWMGVEDFASFDAKFREVDGIHLWNDLVHAPRGSLHPPTSEVPPR
jgi:predicted nucleic acid-binding protein